MLGPSQSAPAARPSPRFDSSTLRSATEDGSAGDPAPPKLLTKVALERFERDNRVRALEAADTIQLLLTDIIMPQGLGGLELAERFQREKANLQVVIARGYSPEISARSIPSKPNVSYLAKPFEMVNLATTLRT